ncbi:site-specific integrase [Aureimonas ureilytica]|uniref:hypothetical protein n=1 Tax=Aureimonas ureilytica TaxID=401562 RepID=UPI00035D2AC5|nr:hypothetical protein [Aureimonas ureilytica]
MTRTPHSGRPVSPTNVEPTWQADLVMRVGEFSSLARMPWRELARVELFPGVALGSATVVVPERYLPSGPLRRSSARTLDATCGGKIVHADTSARAARLAEGVGRLLLALALPSAVQKRGRVLTASSFLSYSRTCLTAVKWIIENAPSSDGSLWAHLDARDLRLLVSNFASSEARSDFFILLERFREAHKRGILNDFLVSPLPEPASRNPPLEATYKERPPRAAASGKVAARLERDGRHFPDAYVDAIISRALYFSNQLAPAVLDCWVLVRDAGTRWKDRSGGTSNSLCIAERKALIARFAWRDADGNVIAALPFPVWQKIEGKFCLSNRWPPEDARSFRLVVRVIQVCNYALVAFCTGMRNSEIASAEDQRGESLEACLFEAKTSKYVDAIAGRSRDWPIHPLAAQALRVQQRLAETFRPEGAKHLWVHLKDTGDGDAGSPLLNFTEPMVQVTEHLGLKELAGDRRPHMHRWRHTIARLVALACAEAPQILLDLLGHADFEQVMVYMLSDPDIAAEATRVAREARIVLAEEAIGEVLEGLAGGNAAAPMKQGLANLRMRRGAETFGSDSMRELAEVLTFGGKTWNLVRPGVLCTKALGEYGPCTKGYGNADPGSCRTGCDHRLETARARSHAAGALEQLLEELAAAEAEGATMLVANFEGQILAQLRRWDDLRRQLVETDAAARRIWERAQ